MYLFISWILLASCSSGDNQQEAVASMNEYYDVQGLLAQSEEELRQMKVVLEKKAEFAGEVERSALLLDSATLAYELDVFREVDINKPVLSGRYLVREEQEDGLHLTVYEADEKDELNINFLKVYKNPKSGAVERLEALFSNRNILYNSTRLLSLQYENQNGRLLPAYYTVEGVQKMIFSDKETYKINARFVY